MPAITVEDIIKVHDLVTEGTADDTRLTSEAGLHEIVFLASRIEDPHLQAACIIFSICAYPPFRDGNKRTAIRIADDILSAAGLCRKAGDDEIFDLMRGVAAFTVEQDDIKTWLREHTAGK